MLLECVAFGTLIGNPSCLGLKLPDPVLQLLPCLGSDQ